MSRRRLQLLLGRTLELPSVIVRMILITMGRKLQSD